MSVSVTAEHDRGVAGKYITFQLAGEEYGIRIQSIREIVGMVNITQIPQTPGFIRGVINLRGRVIPVVDLRRRFEIPGQEYSERTPIIIAEIMVEGELHQIGIVVDSVTEVLQVHEEDVEDPPSFGVRIDTSFLVGMAKKDAGISSLLDIEQVLTSAEFTTLQSLAE